jgi:hypothetical protein
MMAVLFMHIDGVMAASEALPVIVDTIPEVYALDDICPFLGADR